MNATNRRELYRLLDRALVGAAFFLALVLFGVSAVRAGEIVPSIGITRAVDGGDQSQLYGGLALRNNIVPFLKSEIGIAYRSDEYFGGDLKVRQWPVTASLWVTPIPTLYAGGGVGWYHTTLDYADALGFESETDQQFGVHLGGGLTVPIAPVAALDLNGRYIFMEKQGSQLPPNEFDPDFWSTTVGLAIRF